MAVPTQAPLHPKEALQHSGGAHNTRGPQLGASQTQNGCPARYRKWPWKGTQVAWWRMHASKTVTCTKAAPRQACQSLPCQ